MCGCHRSFSVLLGPWFTPPPFLLLDLLKVNSQLSVSLPERARVTPCPLWTRTPTVLLREDPQTCWQHERGTEASSLPAIFGGRGGVAHLLERGFQSPGHLSSQDLVFCVTKPSIACFLFPRARKSKLHLAGVWPEPRASPGSQGSGDGVEGIPHQRLVLAGHGALKGQPRTLDKVTGLEGTS